MRTAAPLAAIGITGILAGSGVASGRIHSYNLSYIKTLIPINYYNHYSQ